MGLFVSEDGHFQGWLAALLCCCAAIDDDESPAEYERSRIAASNRAGMCYQQPPPLRASSALAPVVMLNTSEYNSFPLDDAQKDFNRARLPPSLSPLDFGERPWLGSWPLQSSEVSFPAQIQSRHISAPYGFRHLGHTDAQKQGLIPLRLGPVVLRDSPAALSGVLDRQKSTITREHGGPEPTEDLLMEAERPQSYRANRESPFQRCRQQSLSARSVPFPSIELPMASEEDDIKYCITDRPSSSKRSSSRSPSRHGADTSTTSLKSRTSSERVHPRRKRSFPLLRKDDNNRLEQEILELNTIVEERRADHGRHNSRHQHVPAVAPAMLVRARSETLDAIGSALSRPLGTSKPRSVADSSNEATPRRHRIWRCSSSDSWASSHFSGCYDGTTPPSSPPRLPNSETLYKYDTPQRSRRTYSEASAWTSGTEADSPSFTGTSSPPLQAHSRSLTDDSQVTPLSRTLPPPDVLYREKFRADERLRGIPFQHSYSEVGLAV